MVVVLFCGLVFAPHAPHLFRVFLAKARRTQRDFFSFSLLKYIPLTPFARAQKKPRGKGELPISCWFTKRDFRGMVRIHFFRKWGVVLLFVVFIVGCFDGYCVVFVLVVCTPCTPKVSAESENGERALF